MSQPPLADPMLTTAFDLNPGTQQVIPVRDRGPAWCSGWSLGLPPGITPEQWPLSRDFGYPLRHAFTLHLPEQYRRQGQDLVALAFFVDDQSQEFPSNTIIQEYFNAALSPEPPLNAALLPLWVHRQQRHAHQHDVSDILGSHYAVIWLTQAEFDGPLCTPPAPHTLALEEGLPDWMHRRYADFLEPGDYGASGPDGESALIHTGGPTDLHTGFPIHMQPRAGDPNVGRPAREWEWQCKASGYIPAYSDEGVELKLDRWRSCAHLGGTMMPIQGYPDFGPYYLEFEENLGGFNFGGGNAQLDLENVALDWACG